MSDELPLAKLPPRAADSHKGDFGHVLIIGGSLGMSGAVALAGAAALRSGAGLVKLATPAACVPIVAALNPCYMTIPLAADSQGRIARAAQQEIEQAAGAATAVACGPGLGRSDELIELVRWLYRSLELPLVIDADALNALSELSHGLPRPAGPRILTPHPGEFARLTKAKKIDPDQRQKLAVDFAKAHRVVMVLKGHRTIITDGDRVRINDTGNPGMATGGTGDVLTGITAALVGQKLPPAEAAALAVHVHGLAGDLAAEELGQVGLTASDLVDHLPAAFRKVAG